MGHKVNPTSLRLGITEPWRSRWYANKRDFGHYVVEDERIRRHIKEQYRYAGIPRIDIERTRELVKIILYTARPGIIIGRKGSEVDKLKGELESIVGREVVIKIQEVADAELEAQLVAEGICEQLSKRAHFRRVMKKASDTTMQAGAKGIKIQVSGRLRGAEIARTERLVVGEIPLHTLRADISYGLAEAKTTYGHIGVKVWVYRGLYSEKEVRHAPHAQTGEVSQEPEGPNQG
ncbi:MAG: 30S ribosomal protein S3 [Planctomycetota bacterium]